MTRLEGMTAADQRRVAQNIENAAGLIQNLGLACGMSIDMYGQVCALEALAEESGHGTLAAIFGGPSTGVEVNEAAYAEFQASPEVTAFSQYLLREGLALLVNADETATQVIYQWSDDNDKATVVAAMRACARDLEV